jgi:hypothetical protein
MSTLGQKLKHEMRELLPVMVFFFITFQLLAVTQSLMLEQYGIRVSAFLTATVMALVVAKVVLIADHFPIVNRFPDKPLSYNVVWKTTIYFTAALAFRYAEHLVHSGARRETSRKRTGGFSTKSSGRISGACNSGCSSCCWSIARSENWSARWVGNGSSRCSSKIPPRASKKTKQQQPR